MKFELLAIIIHIIIIICNHYIVWLFYRFIVIEIIYNSAIS